MFLMYKQHQMVEEDSETTTTTTMLSSVNSMNRILENNNNDNNDIDDGGPGGDVIDIIWCLFPIVFLLYGTLNTKHPIPTTVSLPCSALFLLLIRLAYFGHDPILVLSSVVLGIHESFTPLSIMAGAILLFETMKVTKCLSYIMNQIHAVCSGYDIATIMLLFSFSYMIEGASGFGTPVALCAPMLLAAATAAEPATTTTTTITTSSTRLLSSLTKQQAVTIMLIFNTVATVWGAVGTPIWYGFGSLDLMEDEYNSISTKAAITLGIVSFIIIPIAIQNIIVPITWRILYENIVFITLSIAGTIVPSIVLAIVKYEFASLVGGITGCIFITLLVQCNIGLSSSSSSRKPAVVQETVDEAITKTKGSYDSDRDQKSTTISSTQQEEDEREEGEEQEKRKQEPCHGLGTINESTKDIECGLATDVVENERQQHKSNGTDIDHDDRTTSSSSSSFVELLGRTFPIWGVVVLLIVTRVEAIGLKTILMNRSSSIISIQLGTYGRLKVSSSLVLQLENILHYPNMNWKYELLYIPFFVPFVLISFITMILYRKDMITKTETVQLVNEDSGNGNDIDGGSNCDHIEPPRMRTTATTTTERVSPIEIVLCVIRRLASPAKALLGALVLVQLMIRSGNVAPAYIIGTTLARWFKNGFIVISPFLGALGSFFSGSTTVSNLTFGPIQQIAATSMGDGGISRTSLLALQVVGASLGNGICLNNIIAACAVVGLTGSNANKKEDNGTATAVVPDDDDDDNNNNNDGSGGVEGSILLQTYKYVLLGIILSTGIMVAFFY